MNTSFDRTLLRDAKPVLVTATGPIAGDVKEHVLSGEMTIADAIAKHEIVFRLPTIAVIASATSEPEPVLRGQWHVRMVRSGETLTLLGLPRGGGNTKRIVGVIASLALSIAAPFVGTAAATALGLAKGTAAFTAAAGLASGAFMVGASVLLSTLLRPSNGPKTNSEAEQVYMTQASGNRAMPLEPIPCPYGRIRFPPPYASRPYFEFSGNDQYLYQLHCWGVGSSTIERWEIGDTLAWSSTGGFTAAFKDIEMQIVQPGEEIKLFPANVTVSDNVSGQNLPDPPDRLGPFTVNPPSTEIEEIALDFVFPGGLFKALKGGNNGDASRTVVAQYRAIDDLGQPVTGTWSTLFSQTYTMKTRTPQRITKRVQVPAGRYEVRFYATDRDTSEDEGEEPVVNRVSWAGLRGYLKNFVTPPGVTLIATKIRANEQVSGAASGQYFFTGQRRLPVYDPDGDEWVVLPTRNPAWAVADALRNSDYGLGMSDSQIDVAWLAQYAALWDSRGDRFDGVFDRQWVAMEALNAILEVGRAQLVRLGGRVGFVRDEPKLVRRHVFTPRNIVRDSIERNDVWFDESTPDHVRARFINQDTWQEETIDCIISSVGSADAQEMEMFGIVDRDHAWREGIYRAADNAYRRSFRKFTVEAEGRLLVRGDPIALHDPMGTQVGAQIAAITAFDASPTAPKFTVDRDIELPEADNIYVAVRDRYGREWGPCLVDSISGRTINLNATNRFVVEANHGQLADVLPGDRSEPAHISILADQTRLWNGLLVSAEPNGRLYDIVCVNDDQRVHLADQTEITPAPYTPPDIFSPRPDAPEISGLYANAYRTTFHIELEAGWQPSAGAARYVAEISYDDDAQGNPDDVSWTPVHDSAATRLAIPILPQAVTLRVAAIGARQGPWAYFYISAVPELNLPPEVVNEEALSLALKAQIQQLDERILVGMQRLREELESLAGTFLDGTSGLLEQIGQVRIGAGSQYEDNLALAQLSFVAITDLDQALSSAVLELQSQIGNIDISAELNEVYLAIASVDEALSLYILSAESQFENLSAGGLFQIVTGTAPAGVSARIEAKARAELEDAFAQAGFAIDVGVTALGGKPQVQLYAETSSGSARQALVLEDGRARLDGKLLLPRSVVGIQPETGSTIGQNPITYSSGNYDSGWVDAVEHEVEVDNVTEFVDFNLFIGPYAWAFQISAGSVSFAVRLTRNGTQVWPPPAYTNGAQQWPDFVLTTVNVSITTQRLVDPVMALDFPPSPGTYTYKWQGRFRISGGVGTGAYWSAGPMMSRVLLPKNQV